ncbi:circularly permuted type 2 ATP-grasp protein [Klebsiella variicola subsp. variicola]|nr:circularly permuted type 2 ATP-grasp protein [Klebsiella variicola subsp. variicola]
MLVGPRSTKEEREAFRQRLLANPANYIAQDTLALSTCPPSLMKVCRRDTYRFHGPTCCPGRRCGWCPAA